MQNKVKINSNLFRNLIIFSPVADTENNKPNPIISFDDPAVIELTIARKL